MTTSRLIATIAAAVLLAGCGAEPVASPAASGSAPSTATSAATTDAVGFWDAGVVHDLSVEVDPAQFRDMVETFRTTGEKQWLHAAATVNGTRYADVGLRLKGNLTLREVTTSTDPAEVPLLVKLDKYVDGQTLDGWTELAERSSTSQTALTEGVALDLLSEAGLAASAAVSVRFSINSGAPQLRLIVQDPDSTWDDAQFSTDGLLYKAEAGGDYSYRGDDPAAYEDVFDQEAGADDLTPLIDLLDFLNNSSDAQFTGQLDRHVDVAAFARYLAFEELVANRDDIEGGGNNSYLRLDTATGVFTVVAWDHNSAFGGGIGPGGQGRGRGGGRAGGAAGSRTNVLVQRFKAVPTFVDLLEQARADLREELFASGAARQALAARVAVLKAQADDLVDGATVDAEAARVASHFVS